MGICGQKEKEGQRDQATVRKKRKNKEKKTKEIENINSEDEEEKTTKTKDISLERESKIKEREKKIKEREERIKEREEKIKEREENFEITKGKINSSPPPANNANLFSQNYKPFPKEINNINYPYFDKESNNEKKIQSETINSSTMNNDYYNLINKQNDISRRFIEGIDVNKEEIKTFQNVMSEYNQSKKIEDINLPSMEDKKELSVENKSNLLKKDQNLEKPKFIKNKDKNYQLSEIKSESEYEDDNDIISDFLTDENSNYYDMILDFNSFEQLKNKGWTANFTLEGKKKYDKSILQNNIVIGVVGIKNRGKSFLLGRIMDNENYKPPNGFLVTTYGISCKFPILEKNDKTFVALDIAGKDNPLLQNAFYNDKEIKSIARDQKVSEIVLSDFIIQESNILIAVVEQLSFAEQEMLKTLIDRLRQKEIKGIEKRRLIVIHNLMNITTIKGINDFIHNILLKSLTFSLETQSMSKDENYNDTDKYFYIQNFENSINESSKNNKGNPDNLEIIHLVIGNDNSEEIKKEFNEPAFRFIRDNITIDTSRKFDILNNFKDFIIKNSKKYMNGDGFKNDSLYIGNEEHKKVFINKDNKNYIDKIIIPIKLKDKNIKEFNLKGVYVDSKGIHSFLNNIETRYSSRIIKNNNKYFIEITFEMFGKLGNLEKKIEYDEEDNNQIIFFIKGEIEDIKDLKENEPFGNLKYSQFDFQVKIDKYLNYIENNKVNENIFYEIELIDEEPNLIEDTEYGIYKLIYPITVEELDNN